MMNVVMEQCPLVSFVVLAYNQADYIEEAIRGALSQTYGNMEIIVSDDCSQDDTYARAHRVLANYDGDKKTYLYRNGNNMGLIPHINKILTEYVHGDYIALAGGDDISLPERVEDTVAEFSKDDTVMAVCGQSIVIDAHGNVLDKRRYGSGLWRIDESYIRDLSFMTCGYGLSFRQNDVFTAFGVLEKETPTEDSTLRFRALLRGKIKVSDRFYIKYRKHDGSLTNKIYELKTKYIAKQYETDLAKALSLKLIDGRLYGRLVKKIRIYYINRYLAEKKRGKHIVLRAPIRIAQNLNKLFLKWI